MLLASVPSAGARAAVVRCLVDGAAMWAEYSAPYFIYGKDGDSIRHWRVADVVSERACTLDVASSDARFYARLCLWTA